LKISNNLIKKGNNEGDFYLFIIQKYPTKGKKTSDSAIDTYKISLFDEHTSSNEVIFGGRILNLVHDVAINVAKKHSEISCQIIGIDFIRCYSPIKLGDILVCSSQVNRVWLNKMEVGVKVVAEDFRTLDQRRILSAYFIFMSNIDEKTKIPRIIPQSELDKRRYSDAEKRRKIREKRKTSF